MFVLVGIMNFILLALLALGLFLSPGGARGARGAVAWMAILADAIGVAVLMALR
jgi:hypothetical protein